MPLTSSSRTNFVPAEDAALVSQLLTQAIDWMSSSTPYGALWRYEDVTPNAISMELQHYYIGLISDTPVLTFKLTDNDDLYWPDVAGSAIYIHRIAVARANAAKATGHSFLPEIFQFAAEMAKENGINCLRLDCDRSRPALRRLYERYGFAYHSNVRLNGYLGARYQLDLE